MKRFYFNWTERNVEKLIELHKQELRYRAIAEELGCSENAVKMKTKELRDKGILERRK
jgi:DNA-binding Lrp family transcriptional regulator